MAYDSTMALAFGQIALGFVILFAITPEAEKGWRQLFLLMFFTCMIVISSIILLIQNDTFTLSLFSMSSLIFLFVLAYLIYVPVLRFVASVMAHKKL
jgi:hypothetical protein